MWFKSTSTKSGSMAEVFIILQKRSGEYVELSGLFFGAYEGALNYIKNELSSGDYKIEKFFRVF